MHIPSDADSSAPSAGTGPPDLIDVIFEGGPDGAAGRARVDRASAARGTIKIQRHGGYEHFERVGGQTDPDGGGTPVFRWTSRTAIAE
jgi:hypothetical protein